jgi:Uma2 family endonuclease
MTTKALVPAPKAPPPDDPFYYGWRPVKRVAADGMITFDQIPLTLDDVLHPQCGDVMPHYDAHQRDLVYLDQVARDRLRTDPTALVLFDVLHDLDVPRLRPVSPDLSVITGLTDPGREWSFFDVARERMRPVLLIEVVSPRYRENDVTTKVGYYHRARIPWYVIVDRDDEAGPVSLTGYHYARGGYQPMAPDVQGRLWVDPLGLWLGARENRVICFTADGAEVGNYSQLSEELGLTKEQRDRFERLAAKEARRAEREARKAVRESAAAEQARLTAAAAEQARLEAERLAAQARKEKAQAERKAKREAARATKAEERLRQLQAELDRLRRQRPPAGGPPS